MHGFIEEFVDVHATVQEILPSVHYEPIGGKCIRDGKVKDTRILT